MSTKDGKALVRPREKEPTPSPEAEPKAEAAPSAPRTPSAPSASAGVSDWVRSGACSVFKLKREAHAKHLGLPFETCPKVPFEPVLGPMGASLYAPFGLQNFTSSVQQSWKFPQNESLQNPPLSLNDCEPMQ